MERKSNRSKSQNDMIFMEGKIQPQVVDMEEVVLGALLQDKNAIREVTFLKPEHFYKESHVVICKAIYQLYTEDKPYDIVSVTHYLRSTGELDIVGGAYYVTQLTNRVANASNIVYHAQLISQTFVHRELIRVSSEIQRESFEEGADAFEQLDLAEAKLAEVRNGIYIRNGRPIAIIADDVMKDYDIAADMPSGITGVPSGIHDLDVITHGFQPSDYILVAGRPGMSKTALACTILKNVAVDRNIPCAFFSIEMSDKKIFQRMVCAMGNLDFELLQTGRLSDSDRIIFHELSEKIKTSPLYIDDSPALTANQFKIKVKKLVALYGIKLVICDYVQLKTSSNPKHSENEKLTEISWSAKQVAKENNIPVIDLSQLNREVEKTPSKRPMLSHLKDSGALEANADVVIFLYRPEYYGINEDFQGNSTKNRGEFIIAKHRNGYVGSAWAYFYGKHQKWTSLELDEDFYSGKHVDRVEGKIDDKADELPF